MAFATGGSFKVMAQCDGHNPSGGPNTMAQVNGDAFEDKSTQLLLSDPFKIGVNSFLVSSAG